MPLMAGNGRATAAYADRTVLQRLNDRWLDRHFFRVAALPAFLLVFAVTVVPIALGLVLSLTNYSQSNASVDFVGVDNFTTILTDETVHQVLWTTLLYVFGAVTVETVIGVCLALLLARQFRGIGLFRTMYLVPLMVAGVVAAVAWKALFHTTAGWVNHLLGLVHLPQPDWLGGPATALPAVIVADMWVGIPVVATLSLAGLLGMPRDPLEAARVDGASALQSFRYLVLPALRPVLAFVILFRLVEAFRQFALFQIMTGGGPGTRTTVLNYFIYQATFAFGNLGYGAALGVLLMVIMVVPLALLFQLSRR